MEKHRIDGIEIDFGTRGRRDWMKLSYPATYGISVKVRSGRYEFDFNLKGELKRITGRPPDWPDPSESLKRTDAGDYIYYSSFGYESARALTGGFYVPYTGHEDPAVFNERPLGQPHVAAALAAFDSLAARAAELTAGVPAPGNTSAPGAPDPVRRCESATENENPPRALLSSMEPDTESAARALEFLAAIARNGRGALASKASRLHEIIGGPIPVLPPDAMRVDYEVIPLIVADGCLYNCRFCNFAADPFFEARPRENIDAQVAALRGFYGEDLVNFNAVVLGGNDALAAGADTVEHAARAAYEGFRIADSWHEGAFLFTFASAASLSGADAAFLGRLAAQPFKTFINIGLESPDAETLEMLGKPVGPEEVRAAFRRAVEINNKYENVAVTMNFVVGDELPESHYEGIKELLSSNTIRRGLDTVYLAPLIGASSRRRTIDRLMEIKRAARPEVYLYLFQQL